MPYNPEIHHRRSIRLKGYDYSQEGMYYITICVQDRVCLFGEIAKAPNLDDVEEYPIMKLNDAGKIAEQCWLAIPQHFPSVLLHSYVVMPNHIHGIIEITNNIGVTPGTDDGMVGLRANNGTTDVWAKDGITDVGAKNGITDVGAKNGITDVGAKNGITDVGAKNFSPLQTRSCAQSPSRTIGSIIRGFKIGVTKWFERSVWQRNYYEHIIRSMDEYERITDYINNNPANWHEDNFYT